MRNNFYLIFALLVVRAAFLMLVPGILNGDGVLYALATQEILQTGLAPEAVFQSRAVSVLIAPIAMLAGPSAFQPIAPAQLTLGHPIAQAVLYFHVLLDLAVVGIILSIFWKMRPPGKILFRVGIIVIALQPFTAAWANHVLPDQMAAAAFFIGLYLLARIDGPNATGFRLAAAGAFLFGISGLLRIDMALLAVALIAAWMVLLLRPLGKGWVAMGTIACLALATPMAMMSGYQYVSRGSFAYIDLDAADNPDVAQAGYNRWTRAWVSSHSEFQQFVLEAGSDDWRGFSAAAFPDRAFADGNQRVTVQGALTQWRDSGYSPAIDARFRDAANALRQSRPAQAYLIAPLQRTALAWIYPDGAALFHQAFALQPPWTKVATAIVGLLKLPVGLLALLGIAALVREVSRNGLQYLRTYPIRVVALSCAALLLRAIEMFAINLLIKSPALESRYVLATLPAVLILSVYGLQFLLSAWNTSRTWIGRPAQA